MQCNPAQLSLVLLTIFLSFAGLSRGNSQEPNGFSDSARNESTSSEVLFVRRIAPLFREKCLACHGEKPDEIEGGFDLQSFESLLKGGDSEEPGIIAGKPKQSPIYLAALRDDESFSAMPPKEAEKLSDLQLQHLRDWISTGAKWPSKERQSEIEKEYEEAWSAEDGVTVKTSGGLSPAWTNRKYKPADLWAYQPVKKTQFDKDANQNPIDVLIQNALPTGLKVAPPATRRDWIRRASFNLTGLPPSPKDVAAFANDEQSDDKAFAKVIDRLLASAHYGERMAQHWLDVARYADSSGFANDFERGNAWRYRDYVVRSFNNDKPYDQFVREQIAGDELDANDPEKIIATGFLRMGPWELTSMEVPKVARQRFLDDVTNSVGETFLAHSLQCARCHDHKFDPIPTRDYYSMQAVFATTQLAERNAKFLKQENLAGFDEQKYLQKIRQAHFQTQIELDQILMENAERWFKENNKSPKHWNESAAKLKKKGQKKLFNTLRSMMAKAGLPANDYPPKLVGYKPTDFGRERVANKGLQRLNWEFDRYRPFALAVYNGRTRRISSVGSPLRVPKERMKQGDLEKTTILTGGDPFARGQAVAPGTLSAIHNQLKIDVPDSIEGRRTALAKWIANPKNPLTARVIVNRIWQWHFGKGLAANANNFGATGEAPSHPLLLDYLANKFVEDGWSVKELHRHIMLSSAYRRSTKHPNMDGLLELDPLRKSHAVFEPRRLTAEEIRDSTLAVTGELNKTLGGIPCRPEINPEVALQPRQVMGSFAAAWVPNPLPTQRHRRSIYILKLRGLPAPFMEVFNAPAPDFSCEKRGNSTVTPQVFNLFNSQQFLCTRACVGQSCVD